MRRVLTGTGAAALVGVIGWAFWGAGGSAPARHDRQALQAMPESNLPQLVQLEAPSEPQMTSGGNFGIQLVGWRAARRPSLPAAENPVAHEAPGLLTADANAPQRLSPAEEPLLRSPEFTDTPVIVQTEPASLPLTDAPARPLVAEPTPMPTSAAPAPASDTHSDHSINPLRPGATAIPNHAATFHRQAPQLPWRDNPLR